MNKVISLLLINTKNIGRKVGKLLLQLIAIFSSIVSLIIIYYTKSGKFKFESTNLWDWIIAVIAVISSIVAIVAYGKSFSLDRTLKVNRKELNVINARLWDTANSSITIIAGDLSWIRSEVNDLHKVKETKHISVNIYCDLSRANTNTFDLLNEMKHKNFNIRSYSDGNHLKIRCLIIDKEDGNNVRLVKFNKIETSNAISRGTYLVSSASSNREIVQLVSYILRQIDDGLNKPLLIGITGTNNVGKTVIAKGVLEKLKNKHNVRIIDDAFRNNGEKTRVEDNLKALFMQICEVYNKNYDIIIMDRTPADTLAFIKLFDQDIYEAIMPEIRKIMKEFDCLFNIQIKGDDFQKRTSLVKAADRKKVFSTLKGFYNNNSIKYTLLENYSNSDASKVRENIDIACQQIENMIKEKKIK